MHGLPRAAAGEREDTDDKLVPMPLGLVLHSLHTPESTLNRG
jgi:hypothetical protein